jgi:hypothetical protein
VLTIFLSPILVVLALQLPLVNQLNYADAWFYSAYGWAPKHHFAEYGFNYFAVRFPAVLSIGLFEKAFGVHAGYLLLRYLLAVATGGSLYVALRQFATVPVALASTLLLYLSPFFARMLLWDYSYFLAVSVGLVGLAVWWWAEGRHWAWTFLAGAALSAAIFAHALFITVVFILVVIEIVATSRRGRAALATLAARLGLCLAAGIAVFALGFLAYRALLGPIGPYDLLRPTVTFLRDNDAQIKPYVQPTRLWLLHEPRIWAPVVLSVALIAVLRRRILGIDLPARMAQMCVAFTAFVWLYRFTVTSSFIEVWWSYDIIVVVMAPALGVLIHTLGKERPGVLRWSAIALLAAGLTALVIRDVPWAVRDFYTGLNRHSWEVVTLLVLALLCAVLVTSRRRGLGVGAFVGLLVLSGVMTFAPDILDGRGGTGVFVTDARADWVGYKAGHDFVELVRDHEGRGRQVFLWYPSTLGYQDIAWADLPQYGQTLQALGVQEPMNVLTPLATARLQQPQVSAVLIMSPRPADLVHARSALRAAGYANSVEAQGRLADGKLPYVLVRLRDRTHGSTP